MQESLLTNKGKFITEQEQTCTRQTFHGADHLGNGKQLDSCCPHNGGSEVAVQQ